MPELYRLGEYGSIVTDGGVPVLAGEIAATANAMLSALEAIEALADEHADADYSDRVGRAIPNQAMVIRDIARRAIEKAK